MSEAMTYKLPPLPETGYMMGGKGYSGSQMQAYAIAAIEAQGVPDGLSDDDLSELAHSANQEAMSFGLGHDLFLRYFKTLRNRALASAPPAPQAKPQPLTSDQKWDMWTAATIEQPSARGCYFRGVEDAEHAHGITKE